MGILSIRLAGLTRGPVLVSVLALTVTLALLPVGGHHLAPTTSYLPAILAVVACFDLMSMWLLAGEYADNGDRRMLAMGVAYLWSLTLMGGYAFAFPGLISHHPPLATAPSVAPYLYIGWHVGFPALLGAAWSPWPVLNQTDKPARRTTVMAGVSLATLGLGLATVLGSVTQIDHLPVLIHGLNTTAMTEVTAPVALPLLILSLIICIRGVRTRQGPERWTQVTIAVCACDLLLTYVSRYRYSLGWYAGRTMTVTAAAVVLIAMLASFRRIKAQAQHDAAYDALTALPNRRSIYDTLTAMMARAHRMHTQLAVVMFDLDHFKHINDTHGHAAGDDVLRAVAESMRASVRDSDMIGRIGGEEFLILLPDASLHDAHTVTRRLQACLRLTGTPALHAGITASFGIAALQPGDTSTDTLTTRADHAMYEAKAAGRDRIALATTDHPTPHQHGLTHA